MFSVNFSVDSALENALKLLQREQTSIRAVVVTIGNEVMNLNGNPIEATTDMGNDLSKVRELITKDKLEAAFIIVKLENNEYAQVSFCEECVRAKTKMLYAAGIGYLAGASGLPRVSKLYVESAVALVPSLFEKETSKTRGELMTEDEKACAATKKNDLVPQPVALPGVTVPFTDEGVLELGRFARGEVQALTFKVEPKEIVLDQKLEVKLINATTDSSPPSSSVIDALKNIIPVNLPRFVVLRYPLDDRKRLTLMVYICPSVCKGRELVAYALSKGSFISQANIHGVTFDRRLELDSVDELQSTVEGAPSRDAKFEDDDRAGNPPPPPHPPSLKGPRMLI